MSVENTQPETPVMRAKLAPPTCYILGVHLGQWSPVSEDGDKGVDAAQLAVHTQQQEHEEEEDGPKGSSGHVVESFGQHHKDHSSALCFLQP